MFGMAICASHKQEAVFQPSVFEELFKLSLYVIRQVDWQAGKDNIESTDWI
jgi:hypothetical protein